MCLRCRQQQKILESATTKKQQKQRDIYLLGVGKLYQTNIIKATTLSVEMGGSSDCNPCTEEKLQTALSKVLLAEGICFAEDEAEVMADAVASELSCDLNNVVEKLQEIMDIPLEQATTIESEIRTELGLSGEDEESDSEEPVSEDDEGDENSEDEEEHHLLIDGECELCDRYIKLTRHHLIPKSTWPKIQTRLQQAAAAKEKGDLVQAAFILGHGLEYVLVNLASDKSCIRSILSQTCDICRPCHSAVHRSHENIELAMSYSTIEKLLEDDQVSKFCKWANKQRAGKYAVKF